MANLKSGIVLSQGENVIAELEAELWAASANPIAKLIGNIQRIVARIFGHKRKGYLVITDKRVIEVVKIIDCYVFNTGSEVKYVLPSSVKEIGYTKASTCGVFCPAYHLYYDSHTQLTSVQLDTNDENEVLRIVDAFYKTISNSQTID